MKPQITRWGMTLCLLAGTLPQSARADEGRVPISMQAALLAKVVAYDRNLDERAGDHLQVLLISQENEPSSERDISQMRDALKTLPAMAGRPFEVATLEGTDPTSLAKEALRRHAHIVYLGSGFTSADVKKFGAAVSGGNLFTATADPNRVRDGIVLGFFLQMGKPQLLVNSQQASRQNVELSAGVLQLAKVLP